MSEDCSSVAGSCSGSPLLVKGLIMSMPFCSFRHLTRIADADDHYDMYIRVCRNYVLSVGDTAAHHTKLDALCKLVLEQPDPLSLLRIHGDDALRVSELLDTLNDCIYIGTVLVIEHYGDLTGNDADDWPMGGYVGLHYWCSKSHRKIRLMSCGGDSAAAFLVEK